jgi:hypothetical protein
LEVGDTAGLETCVTKNFVLHPPEHHPKMEVYNQPLPVKNELVV